MTRPTEQARPVRRPDADNQSKSRAPRRSRSGSRERPGSAGGDLRYGHWRRDGKPKTRFNTPEAAERETLRLAMEQGADLEVYRCEICSRWHLGHSGDAHR